MDYSIKCQLKVLVDNFFKVFYILTDILAICSISYFESGAVGYLCFISVSSVFIIFVSFAYILNSCYAEHERLVLLISPDELTISSLSSLSLLL